MTETEEILRKAIEDQDRTITALQRELARVRTQNLKVDHVIQVDPEGTQKVLQIIDTHTTPNGLRVFVR